jgi:hypothetical protein
VNEPDFDGYAEAQARLRAAAGQEVLFCTPEAPTWPPGTQLGANGEPLDPSVEPEAGGDFTSSTVTCSVANRPARGALDAPAVEAAIGIEPTSNLLLVCGKKEYDDAELDDATRAVVMGVRYKISSAVPDQVGPGEVQRMLIFVERM